MKAGLEAAELFCLPVSLSILLKGTFSGTQLLLNHYPLMNIVHIHIEDMHILFYTNLKKKKFSTFSALHHDVSHHNTMLTFLILDKGKHHPV